MTDRELAIIWLDAMSQKCWDERELDLASLYQDIADQLYDNKFVDIDQIVYNTLDADIVAHLVGSNLMRIII